MTKIINLFAPITGDEAAPAAVVDEEPMTDEQAHAVIARLARYDDELRALRSNYEAMRAEIERKKAWILQCHETRLRDWTAAQLRGRRRSVRTLHGVVGFRRTPDRWLVTDETQALAWAREHHPEAVVEVLDTKRLPDVANWQSVDPETGEVYYTAPPGIDIQRGQDVLYVKSGRDSNDGE